MPEIIDLCDSSDEDAGARQQSATLGRQQASKSVRRPMPSSASSVRRPMPSSASSARQPASSSARLSQQHSITGPARHKPDSKPQPQPQPRPKDKQSSSGSGVGSGRQVAPVLQRPSSAAQSAVRPAQLSTGAEQQSLRGSTATAAGDTLAQSSSGSRIASGRPSAPALPRPSSPAQAAARPSQPSTGPEQQSLRGGAASTAGNTLRYEIGATGFKTPRLLSSYNAPGSPIVNPEMDKGQKRPHNDKTPLSSGYRPLKKLKTPLPEHPRASAPSSKAVYDRASREVDMELLTSDDDEESPPAALSSYEDNQSQTNASLQLKTPSAGGRLDHTDGRPQPTQPLMSRKSPPEPRRDQTALGPFSDSQRPMPSQTSGGASIKETHNSQRPGTGKPPSSVLGPSSGTSTKPQFRSTSKEASSQRRSSRGSNDDFGERWLTIPESPQLSPVSTQQVQPQASQLSMRDSRAVLSPNSVPPSRVQQPEAPPNEHASDERSIHHKQVLSEPGTSKPEATTATKQPEAARHPDRQSDEDSTYGPMYTSVAGEKGIPKHSKKTEKRVGPFASGSDIGSGDVISCAGEHPPAVVEEEAVQTDAIVDAMPKPHSQQVAGPAAYLPGLPNVSDDSTLTASGPVASKGGVDELPTTAESGPIASKGREGEMPTTTASGPTDISTASAPVPPSIERLVGQYIDEMRDDNEHWTRVELQRARMKSTDRTKTNATSVFRDLTPLNPKSAGKTVVPKGCAKFTCIVPLTTSKPAKCNWYAPYTAVSTSDAVDVPRYSHYVGISENLLAGNVTSLQHWPYFGDDFDMSKAYALKNEYYIDVDSRERKLLRLGQAENFAPYADDLVSSAGIGWSDVLRFLLELKPDVGTIPDAIKALGHKEKSVAEDFTRDGERWGEVLEMLPAPQPDRVGRAAVLCDHFQRLAGFSFWHLVRRSSYTKSLVARIARVADDDEMICRVCMRFNCLHHGEILDHDPSKDASNADNETVETDIILPQVVNFRVRVKVPPTVDSEPATTLERRTLEYWDKGPLGKLIWDANDRGPFYPCHHPGITCADARCTCFDAKIACEKTCSCGPGCERKWKGCLCRRGKRSKGRSVCWDDDRCACWQKGRECDPDLCGDCGVADVLDPVHRHDDRILRNRCRMASIQRGVPKHTILGNSGVHGFGLYACEDIQRDDFVGEYRGECITKDEAERRGAVYFHQKLSYLFSLNHGQEVDATYFGTKLRFINHVDDTKANLRPLIIMVNSVFRIALYAKRKIRAGEELFYDYGPNFPRDQLGGTFVKPAKSGKSRPHVRNSTHVLDDFYDVDTSFDQLGNRRATKAVGAGDSIVDQKERHDGALNGRLESARNGAGRPRKSRRRVEDNTATQQRIEQLLDATDPGHRLSLYNVQEDGSDENDIFEPEEDSQSEEDMESDSE